MDAFRKKLAALNPEGAGRRPIFVAYDQLTDSSGPLARLPARECAILLVESLSKPGRRPYHKQKLALVLANQRHFALEQAARGVHVRYVVADSYAAAVRDTAAEWGPLAMMDPAERELRVELAPLVEQCMLVSEPHSGFLTTAQQFHAACPKPPYRMDRFYQHVRKATGWLMERGKPAGGKWSHDADNREAWRGEPPAPDLPVFECDDVTREVIDLVRARYAKHPGEVTAASLPATHAQAEQLWAWAKKSCLAEFGPFEDAMSSRSSSLFHTRISGLLNLHRLTPRRVCEDVLALDVPLASKEGFIRQILGWREFVAHVHRATDGFRVGPGSEPHSKPSHLGARSALPAAYWGGAPSGLACLDTVVADVWREAYSHHITRLMVLSNIASLLDVEPRALTDWFWVAYCDAYDWVVEPNVLAMGTYGTGELMTTKPYISGAGYIRKMSDYCRSCRFDPARNCPLTPLYWAYLERHKGALSSNPRLFMPMNALAKRTASQKKADAATFEEVTTTLARGEALVPPRR